MNDLNTNYEEIIEQIKKIDTDKMSDDDENLLETKVNEEQKIYTWIRLFLKEESQDIIIGDDIIIKWLPTGEELETKFIAYGKVGIDKDHTDEVRQYVSEDDKKCLSLMVDERIINYSNEIPFIRTLFKTGRYYEYQLVKRTELIFINKRTNIELDYFDCNF